MRSPSRRLLVVTCGLALLGLAQPAAAEDVYFGFFIKNGWHDFLATPVVRVDQGMTSWATDEPFHLIVNGQKGPHLGHAYLQAWYRSVPDPFYAPIGPLAGVITLDFGSGVRGHLALIDTPSGWRTSISLGDATGVNSAVTGEWVFDNGASVVGGTADDMVVGGVVHLGNPISIGNVEIAVNKHFPTVPFASDNDPLAMVGVNASTQLGSYYGASNGRPLRTLRRGDTQWNGFNFNAWLAVMYVPDGSYFIAIMTAISGQSSRFTISGVGDPLLARLTGSGYLSAVPNLSWTFLLKAFVAP